MKILIIGDSFSADWTIKYPNGEGWPNLLARYYDVLNLSQAGVSEYKIHRQLKSIEKIDIYDIVIVSHTSPYRVHTTRHPVHYNDLLHKHADLSLSDIQYHARKLRNCANISLWSAYRFFKDHFDEEFQLDVYWLLVNKIHEQLKTMRCIVINNFVCPPDFQGLADEIVDCSELQKSFPGLHNHLNEYGNQKVFDTLQSLINESA